MTKDEIDQLWRENVVVIDKLRSIEHGSSIRSILLCLRNNGPAYLKLSNPRENKVDYEVVSGNAENLSKCCNHYGVGLTGTTLTA